jgi:hypothetical protein
MPGKVGLHPHLSSDTLLPCLSPTCPFCIDQRNVAMVFPRVLHRDGNCLLPQAGWPARRSDCRVLLGFRTKR